MLGTFFQSGRCPIGVDVGSHSVKLIQLERTGQTVRVLAAAQQPLPEGTPIRGEARRRAVNEALSRAYRGGGFRGKRVVSCLPASAVQYKNLRLPKMPEAEMASAVRWEAQDRLNLGDEPFTVQYYDAGEVRQGEELRQEVILMAASTPVIERHVQMLLGAGLHPEAIDAAPGALLRCFDRGLAEQGDAQVVIDAGYDGTKVLIFRGRSVLFFKQIPIGGRVLNEEVAKALSMPVTEAAAVRSRLSAEPAAGGESAGEPGPDADATGLTPQAHRGVYEAIRPKVSELAREVGLCLRYYSVTFRGRRPESAVLVGGEARQPGLAAMLSENAGIQVESGEPFGWVDLSAAPRTIAGPAEMSTWGVAAGLSLRSPSAIKQPRPAAKEAA